jgi:hypothetical protein
MRETEAHQRDMSGGDKVILPPAPDNEASGDETAVMSRA